MAKPARSAAKKKKRKPPVQKIDERPTNRILPRSKDRGNPYIPIRTVMYVEIGNLAACDAQILCRKLLERFSNEHPHYLVPLRYGKLPTDMVFENEILAFVKSICEVKNGEIVLKGGARDVEVIRKRV